MVASEGWTFCQIRKIAGWTCAVMPGTFSPPSRVSDPDMHHGTCVTHVPWCMPGSLISGFLWSRWRWKRSRRMHNAQFYVSGKMSTDYANAMNNICQYMSILAGELRCALNLYVFCGKVTHTVIWRFYCFISCCKNQSISHKAAWIITEQRQIWDVIDNGYGK